MPSEATEKLHEAFHVYGYLYCEACDERVDLSSAESFIDAREIALTHHEENHD